ncbi:MAG: hypothetical protein WBE06_00215, partial [Phycisphaerae bacterium]
AALRRALDPKLEVLAAGGKDAASILAQWRRVGKDHVFFFVNVDPKRTVKARVRLPVGGTPIRLDPETGAWWQAKGRRQGRRTTVLHTFEPRQSLLLVVPGGKKKPKAPAEPAPSRRGRALGGAWRLWRRDPNVLVLDKAAWRTDEGEYSEPTYLMDIEHDLVRRGVDEPIMLRFEFQCAIRDLKGRRFELVLEQPERHEMWFGGMRAPLNDAGPWWDSAFRRVDVTPFIRRGTNVIELRRSWAIHPQTRSALVGQGSGWEKHTAYPQVELEAVYLVGDFGVRFTGGTRRSARGSRWFRGRAKMVEEPASAAGTDLGRVGYPFFAGRMTLEREILVKKPSPRAVLRLPAFAAITASVAVNGQEAGTVWKPPYTVPVGGLLVPGRNHVAVTLTTSLRNVLGPLHHADGELYGVGPGSFLGTKGWYGRFAGPGNEYRADYNVVDFGLGGSVMLCT